MRGLKCTHVIMKGMSHRKPITDPANKVLSCVQTTKNILQTYHSCQQPHTLTLRVLALEVTNEADVFLHPIKGPQLQSISYHLHWLLQQLEIDRKRREKYWGRFVT